MLRPPAPQVVVFDLGGVLVPPEGSIGDLAAELEVEATDLVVAYREVRDDYDRGGSPTAFWGRVTASLGRSIGPEGADRLDSVDGARWSRVAPDVSELLAAVTRAQTPLAVLSNAPASLAATVRSSPWSNAFSTLLFSSDVGVLKPEPAIYRAAEQRLGATRGGIVFFDDRQVNVDAACRRGWRATLWTGPADARRTLVAAGAIRP